MRRINGLQLSRLHEIPRYSPRRTFREVYKVSEGGEASVCPGQNVGPGEFLLWAGSNLTGGGLFFCFFL